MAYTLDFEISLGSTKTGLTLAGQLVDSSGVAVGAEIAAGFTEIGTGCYILTASIPDGHRGGIKIYVSGVPATILAFASINPEEAQVLTGITSLANWLRGLARKDAMDVTAKAELDLGGGTYNEATDSLEGSADNIGVAGASLTALGDARLANLDASITSRAAASIFTGMTSLPNWLRGLFRKDAMDAAAKAEVNVGGGTYDETDHSNQAIGDTMAAAAVFPAGAIEFTYTVVGPGAIPIEGASVWISTDNPAVNIIWRGETDAFGVARDIRNMKPWLDAGPYFFWVQHVNYSGTLPDVETVS